MRKGYKERTDLDYVFTHAKCSICGKRIHTDMDLGKLHIFFQERRFIFSYTKTILFLACKSCWFDMNDMEITNPKD